MGAGLSKLLVESSSRQPPLSVWWHLEIEAAEVSNGRQSR